MQIEWCAWCDTWGKNKCPVCGSRGTVEVAYGYPSNEMLEAAQSGEIVLGGCVIGPETPERACSDCRTPWRAEDEEGDPRFAEESLAGVTARRRELLDKGTFDLLAHHFDKALRALPDDVCVVADHATLENALPEWLRDPGGGGHWWEPLRDRMAVTCSAACRDALLAMGGTAVVSIWNKSDGGLESIAGLGPYRLGHSLVVLWNNWDEPQVYVVSLDLAIRPRPTRRIGPENGESRELPSDMPFGLGFHVAGSAGSNGSARSSFLPIDVVVGGRVCHLAQIALTGPVTLDLVRVHVPDGPDAALVASVVESAVQNYVTEHDRAVVSWPKARADIRRGILELRDAISKSSWDASKGPRCLHPRLVDSRCARCGMLRPFVITDNTSVERIMSRGADHDYKVRIGIGSFEARRGIDILRGRVTSWDQPPQPELQSALKPEAELEPKSPPRTARQVPLVAGHAYGHGVIIERTRAEALATCFEAMSKPITVGEIRQLVDQTGETWLLDRVEQWVQDNFEEPQDDQDEEPESGGVILRFEPNEPNDARIGPPWMNPSPRRWDLPADDMLFEIEPWEWAYDEGTLGRWPHLDDIELALDANLILERTISGTTWQDWEADQTVRVEYTPDGEFIRYKNLETIVEEVSANGGHITVDQQLIKKASAEAGLDSSE